MQLVVDETIVAAPGLIEQFAHANEPALSLYVPVEQVVHEDAPASLYEPAAQDEHVDEPAALYEPAAQVVQVDEPSPLEEPASHLMHLPVVDESL